MAGPKVAVIGAGSYFFGKEIIRKMATSPVMAGGTLALVDVDEKVLGTMKRLARRVFAETGCGVRVEASTERGRVLGGADFVVLSFSHRNAHYRGIDTEIAMKHGIRMCSSDTIGPGGIFRALRETPRVLAAARDVERLCPSAWVINFINPTTVLGIALRRYAPALKSFALCDGHHEPYVTLRWLKYAGILPEDATSAPPETSARLDLEIAGVNHFTFILRFRYDGKDMMPAVRRRLVDEVKAEKENPGTHSKARFNKAYTLELFDALGYYPTAISHTKEYVPYFQGHGVSGVRPEPIQPFDAGGRAEEMKAAWKRVEDFAAGRVAVKEFIAKTGSDHASDIMESMWGGWGKAFYINTFNGGAVPNMPADALLELRSDVDMQGPRPQPAGAMPAGLRGLQMQVLDTHELTAEAAVTGDRKVLRRAMLADPIVNNIGDADACIRDLLEAEREALPGYWYKRRG